MKNRIDAAPRGGVELALGEALGPREDRRERVVELVRDARNRRAEGGHLLGLQQLVIEAARLVLELLPVAHVAHERLDAHQARGLQHGGIRRHLDPDHRLVGAAQAEQIVGDGAVAGEPVDEGRTRALVCEAVRLEGTERILRRAGRIAEHDPEKRVGRDGDVVPGADRADVDALVHGLEEPGERLGARRLGGIGRRHGRIISGFGASAFARRPAGRLRRDKRDMRDSGFGIRIGIRLSN